MTDLPCTSCNAALAVEEVLGGARGYDAHTNSSASACPRCGRQLEFQVRTGALAVGYTYFAGSMHFESLFEVEAPRLRRIVEGGGIFYLYGGKRYPAGGGKTGPG